MQQKSLFLATKISLASEISFMSKKSLFYDFIFINIPYWSIFENVLLFTWFCLSIFSISRSRLWIEIVFNLVLRTADISALFLGSLRIFIFFLLCQNWFVCSRVSHIWRRHSSSTLVSRFSYSWFAISRLFCWRNIWQNPPNHWWNIGYQNDSHVIHK